MKQFTVWALVLCLASTVTGQCFTDDEDATKSETTVGALSDGSTNFAFELFKKVAESPSDPTPSGNVFISPLSVWSALTITYLGSQGQTKKELRTGLGIENFQQKTVADLFPKLQEELLHNATETSNYTFNLANKLYFDENVQLKDCIVKLLNAELEKVDFQSAPEPSRELINKYVEEQTNKKIKDLIPPKHIDSNTIMVIVNAAYLKAVWERTFIEAETTEDDFFGESSKVIKTKMMHKTASYLTGEDTKMDCSAIELPYSGDEVSMLVLLPKSNVQDLIPKLNKANLDTLLGNMARKSVQLSLPKFKIEQEMELKENVQALGVNDLFDPDKADLSGFTGSKTGFVSFIRHKTFVEVNEGGTEAAAATAIGVAVESALLPSPEFNINRPFIFLLRNKKLNSISFIGLIKDPTATK